MTNWISFDWDFVTGDCRKANQANRCTANCKGCGDTGVIGRGWYGNGNFDWKKRLDSITDKLLKVKLNDIIVYDNHGEIYKFLNRGDVVYNYDYHTDDYEDDENKTDNIECWNWVNFAKRNGIIVKNYWQIEELFFLNLKEEYNLFVAWSIPYTRQDLDGHLFRLLMQLGKQVRLNGV